MDKLVVDASVFLSSLFHDEVNSKISAKFLAMVKERNILIVLPMLTLFEVLNTFHRVRKDSEATELLHQSFVDMNVSKGLIILSLEAAFLAHFFTYHECFDLKTSDSIMALTAHREKCPLISWDKKLLKESNKHINAYTPEEYLALAH